MYVDKMEKPTNLQEFLRIHNVKLGGQVGGSVGIQEPTQTLKSSFVSTTSPTHTRIGHKKTDNVVNKIFGGSFHIPEEQFDTFIKLYYEYIFIKNLPEYLTEVQLEDTTEISGPILVDFDFRYKFDINQRMHTKDHILNMVLLYLAELKDFYIFDKSTQFSIYIMEKSTVIKDLEKNLTKDGIHMLIGIQMAHPIQQILRSRIITKIEDVWGDLELLNDWSSVFDEGISTGKTNWQLFGSQKPENQPYKLSFYYDIGFDEDDEQFTICEKENTEFDYKIDLYKLMARNTKNPRFPLKQDIMSEYEKIIRQKREQKNNISKLKSGVRMITKEPSIITTTQSTASGDCHNQTEEDEEENDNIVLENIKNSTQLNNAIKKLFSKFEKREYQLREIHEYVSILPEKYYVSGSHLLNRQVAFALKNTDNRLFLTWVYLRSKAPDFDYNTIPQLYQDWKRYFNKKEGNSTLTYRSIIYWAKTDAPREYEIAKRKMINYFVEESIKTNTDYDFALVLYNIYREDYVCAGIKNRLWYVFKDHRWKEIDNAVYLRNSISEYMYSLYVDKTEYYLEKIATSNETLANLTTQIDELTTPKTEQQDNKNNEGLIRELVDKVANIKIDIEKYNNTISRIGETCKKLKMSGNKNAIMNEAMELFYDGEFSKKLDENKYLLGFSNGVIDFKEKCFRVGSPYDYVSKNTGIPYLEELSEEAKNKIVPEIIQFMEQIFPVKELNEYMWDHLASSLIGTTENQTFNIYQGSGSNGKSILAELMTRTLGDYKATVPLSLVEKRTTIGGTSSEIMQLKGVRYAVMQEPTKDMCINEGIIKDLTGGDPLQGRALYRETETFYPQFTLVVCTNVDFVWKSNDDGTWRRIRRVPYMSKFVDKNDINTDDTQYVFPKDKKLHTKFDEWAPVFAHLLVQRAFETNGIVKDCSIVLEASNKYRQSQDYMLNFANECLKTSTDPKRIVKKSEVKDHFKLWYQGNYSKHKIPTVNELVDFMNKKYGKSKGKGMNIYWSNVYIVYNDDIDIDDNEDDADIEKEHECNDNDSDENTKAVI